MSAGEPQAALAPVPDVESARFWDALAEGRLETPKCEDCGHHFFPAMPSCPHCASPNLGWAEVSGKAGAYSWATVHIALHPAFEVDVPYTVVVGELAEGGRIMGRLLGDRERLEDGVALEFDVYRVDGQALPGFRIS
ncbi:MAG TPA: zinc ribbon domain-containing protein [Solirubrobacterales bacterium]